MLEPSLLEPTKSKKMKKLTLVSCMCILLISACKKDDDDKVASPAPVTTPTLSCKVDGVNFVAETVSINWISSGATDFIGCEAIDSLGNLLSFAVDASTIGTYPVAGGQNGVSAGDFTYEPVGEPTFFIFAGTDTGTVTFTSISNYNLPSMSISGSFSYSVTRTPNKKLITQGVFANVKF